MDDPNAPRSLPDDETALRYERFVAEVIKTRKPFDDQPKPAWQRFLETTGGAALITVLIGGIFGQWITSSIQAGADDREFQQAWLKARGDQALLSYTEYLKQRQEVVGQMFQLVGDFVAAADDLVHLTEAEFTPKQRRDVQDRYNAVELRWRADSSKLGFLIRYYHPHQTGVSDTWNETRRAVTVYADCAKGYYMAETYPKSATPEQQACTERVRESQRDEVDNAMNAFTDALETGGKYSWDGWERPECLKREIATPCPEPGTPASPTSPNRAFAPPAS
jgi:hypothetical protein